MTTATVSALGMALAVAGGGLAAAEAPPAYVGLWAADPTWCDAPPAAERRPVRIAEGGYVGYENRCAFTQVTRLGRAKWWIETECEGEGALYRERDFYEVSPDGGTLTVIHLDRGWAEVRFSRCSAK